jgi:alkylhydroperoxidase family enzyme
MARITVPADRDPRDFTYEVAGEIGRQARTYSAAVYRCATLTLREFEAARMRIAQINGCRMCLAFRTGSDSALWSNDSAEVAESFYDGVANWSATPDMTLRERLTAEFAERFALRHDSLQQDEEFWDALHANFSDSELVELALSIGSFLALGRFGRVFGIDEVCEAPLVRDRN